MKWASAAVLMPSYLHWLTWLTRFVSALDKVGAVGLNEAELSRRTTDGLVSLKGLWPSDISEAHYLQRPRHRQAIVLNSAALVSWPVCDWVMSTQSDSGDAEGRGSSPSNWVSASSCDSFARPAAQTLSLKVFALVGESEWVTLKIPWNINAASLSSSSLSAVIHLLLVRQNFPVSFHLVANSRR